MTEEKSDADIFADAQEYLEKNGWWQTALIGPDHRQACGLGAMAASQGWIEWTGRDGERSGVVQSQCQRLLELGQKVMRLNGFYGRDFAFWNDNMVENEQQVIDAFAKAEKIERAGFDPDQGVQV